MVPAWSLPGHVTFKQVLAGGAGKTFKNRAMVGHDDVAFLQYTGGTTGVSKGATLTHGNVLANVEQNTLWLEALYAKKGRLEHPVYVCALPLYHIFALTVNALVGMAVGRAEHPHPQSARHSRLRQGTAEIQVQLLPRAQHAVQRACSNNEDFRKLDFSSLQLTVGGGMAVQGPVAERWRQVTGNVIGEGYGLSETSPVATANRFDLDEFTGTIGLPLPSTDIAIRDDEGNDLPLGEVGEICIRGPQVMAGYWNRPDETAKVMTADGFFRSGDMGFMDENGYTKIVDRKKDMILVSGFNVYPNEIEEVAAGHAGRAGSGGDRHSRRQFRRGGEALRRQARSRPHRAAGEGLVRAKPHQLQAAQGASNSAPNCRRRTWARY